MGCRRFGTGYVAEGIQDGCLNLMRRLEKMNIFVPYVIE
jgi:hypothetical protein